jgi:hypothetical protein
LKKPTGCCLPADGSGIGAGFTFPSGGDHLIASGVCYAGQAELSLHLPAWHRSQPRTSDLEQVRSALRPNTK